MTDTKKRAAPKAEKGFTAEERAAMKDRAAEMKAAGSRADGEAEVLAKIAEMTGADREMAERIHAIVKASAPALTPKTWYGMPAYANAEGKPVCFFQSASNSNRATQHLASVPRPSSMTAICGRTPLR
jgi:hypothetical protein